MISTTARLRTLQLTLLASAAAGLGACSKNDTNVVPPTTAASAPAQVAAAPPPSAAASVPAPVVVAQANTSAYEQGRRDAVHRDARRERAERAPPPRADRDADVSSAGGVDPQRGRHGQQVAAAACRECGVVESVTPVKVQGQTNGVGAVAGGVGGAVVGNRLAGSHNRTLGGVIGAVGGGLLGNAIEKHERTTTAYDVQVRMSDGSLRTVRQSTAPTPGEKVRVEADGLHERS